MIRNILIITCVLAVGGNAIASDSLPVDGESYQQLKLSPPLLADQLLSSPRQGDGDAEITSITVSPFRAFLQSLVIPGWGQKYVGQGTTVGTITFVTDIVLWGGVAGLHAYGNWKEESYLTFASAHAAIDNQGKDHQYYVDIGNYQNIYQYNEQQRRDRDFDELYLADSDFWEWDSNDHRLTFKHLRIQSDNALNNRYYVLGAVFLNHLFSAIHASRQASKLNRSAETTSNSSFDLRITPQVGERSVGLRLTGQF